MIYRLSFAIIVTNTIFSNNIPDFSKHYDIKHNCFVKKLVLYYI